MCCFVLWKKFKIVLNRILYDLGGRWRNKNKQKEENIWKKNNQQIERERDLLEKKMHPINAVASARLLMSVIGNSNARLASETIPFGSLWWSIYAGVSCFLVLFAGIMSGLTLGLMSLGIVELEILQRSGTPKEKKQSG